MPSAKFGYRHFSANLVPWREDPFQREIAMQSYLVENPSILSISEGDGEVEIMDVEVAAPESRLRTGKGNGRVDLLASYAEDTYGIIEIKKGIFSLEKNGGFEQLKDYVLARQKLVEANPNIFYEEIPRKMDEADFSWRAVAVCPKVDPRLIMKLWSGELRIGNVPLIVIELSRFRSSDHNDQLFIFSQVYTELDGIGRAEKGKPGLSRQFEFEGLTLKAPTLALAIVKRWHAIHPEATATDLLKAFPAELQSYSRVPRIGSKFGVVCPVEEAISTKEGDPNGKNRHFLRTENLISLVDGKKFAVSSQWWSRPDRNNISKLIKRAEEIEGLGPIRAL